MESKEEYITLKNKDVKREQQPINDAERNSFAI